MDNNNNKKLIKINKKISNKYQEISEEHYEKLKKMGNLVRIKRKSLKINSTNFSKELNITRPTLKSLEDGTPNISLYLYLKAFSLLGMMVSFHIENK